jgi:tetratricopeptide (TPR) repeat protein
MVHGSVVDYGQENGKQGFKVQNPNFEGEAAKKWLSLLNAEVERASKNTPTQLREKIAQFRKMTKEDPENELAHYRLGQLLMEDEQYAEAARSFERTVELSSDFSKAYQLLGECLVKLDQKDRAIAILTKGWAKADRHGDDASRKTMATLLAELGTAVPLEFPRNRSNK